jgi:hypothetical protein
MISLGRLWWELNMSPPYNVLRWQLNDQKDCSSGQLAWAIAIEPQISEKSSIMVRNYFRTL